MRAMARTANTNTNDTRSIASATGCLVGERSCQTTAVHRSLLVLGIGVMVSGCNLVPGGGGKQEDEPRCPGGRSPDSQGEQMVCVDDEGRFDGPAYATVEKGGRTIWIDGFYTREAPSGRWTCTDAKTGEALELQAKPGTWAQKLWGISLDEVGPVRDEKHLGVWPEALCPEGDWSQLDTIVDDDLGDMADYGLSVVRYTPGKAE